MLDMEVWPDASLSVKDVVHYPDFGEILWRGPGWRAVHSEEGLRRRSIRCADGTFADEYATVKLRRQGAKGR